MILLLPLLETPPEDEDEAEDIVVVEEDAIHEEGREKEDGPVAPAPAPVAAVVEEEEGFGPQTSGPGDRFFSRPPLGGLVPCCCCCCVLLLPFAFGVPLTPPARGVNIFVCCWCLLCVPLLMWMDDAGGGEEQDASVFAAAADDDDDDDADVGRMSDLDMLTEDGALLAPTTTAFRALGGVLADAAVVVLPPVVVAPFEDAFVLLYLPCVLLFAVVGLLLDGVVISA